MTIVVAGRDCTRELEPALRARAGQMARGSPRRRPAAFSSDIRALALREAGSEAQYLDELIRLLRYRHGVDTVAFSIPRRPGFLGRLSAAIKRRLWRALRYQHDRIVFRQNGINMLLVNALEFEDAQRRREADEWRRRLEALERAQPPADPAAGTAQGR